MSNEQRVERIRTVFDDWADRGRAEGMATAHELAARHAFERAGLEVVEQRRLKTPAPAKGEPRSWKHTEGSLFTLGERPRDA